MRKVISFMMSSILILGAMCFNGNAVLAKQISSSKPVITSVYRTPLSNINTYSYIDKSLSSQIQPNGVIKRVYDHSYSTINSFSLSGYSVGPLEQQKLIISVAKGETESFHDDTTITATIKISADISVGVKALINQKLSGEVSGSISKTWSSTTTYAGPPESSSYNARNYYHGVNYDSYSFIVDNYNVYAVYNGPTFMYYETSKAGTTSIGNVKKPIFINYNKDVKY